MRITCPHCGAERVTLLLNRGKGEHGVMVEHLVPEDDTVATVSVDGHGGFVKLVVRTQCTWGNAMVRVS